MSVLDMMLSQIVRKYHNMNIDDYMFHNGTLKGNLTMEHPPTELYSFHLGCTEGVCVCVCSMLFAAKFGRTFSLTRFLFLPDHHHHHHQFNC